MYFVVCGKKLEELRGKIATQITHCYVTILFYSLCRENNALPLEFVQSTERRILKEVSALLHSTRIPELSAILTISTITIKYFVSTP